MAANDKQVGGDHYRGDVHGQHWDVAYQLKWCPMVYAATKYLWRLGRKGDESKKLEDIEKSIHYLQKKAEQLRYEMKVQLNQEFGPLSESVIKCMSIYGPRPPDQPTHVFTAGDTACDATPGYVNQDR